MGKRELLLAGVFIVLGVVVYQFTAPAGDESSSGFSFSRAIDEIRREIRGYPESAEETRRTTIPAPSSLTEVRIVLRTAPITITGEDREDIDVEFHVTSNGRDKADAESLVKQSLLRVDQAGAVVILTGQFPEPGSQRAQLTIRMPRRLAVRMDEKIATMKIDGVGEVTVGNGSGETTISNVAGQVALTQRGSKVSIENVGGLKLNASAGAEATISGVGGNTALTLQSAEITARALAGGLEVDARNSDLRFEELARLNGTVRLNLTAGELRMTGLATEARVDGRRTEMFVDLARAVPLAIYNDSEPVEVTLPRGGWRLDAVASDARVSLDPALQKLGLTVEAPADRTKTAGDERVAGEVGGGGALLTIRNARADIVLRMRDASTGEEAASK